MGWWLSHIETLKCTRETKIYSLNLHSISLEFNISMPTVKRTDFLFPYLNIHCVNILPLKGLQLVSYDPFHGILTIERKPNFARIYDAHRIYLVCGFVSFVTNLSFLSACEGKALDFKYVHTYIVCSVWQVSKVKRNFHRFGCHRIWHRDVLENVHFIFVIKLYFVHQLVRFHIYLHSSKSVYISLFHRRTLCTVWI